MSRHFLRQAVWHAVAFIDAELGNRVTPKPPGISSSRSRLGPRLRRTLPVASVDESREVVAEVEDGVEGSRNAIRGAQVVRNDKSFLEVIQLFLARNVSGMGESLHVREGLVDGRLGH